MNLEIYWDFIYGDEEWSVLSASCICIMHSSDAINQGMKQRIMSCLFSYFVKMYFILGLLFPLRQNLSIFLLRSQYEGLDLWPNFTQIKVSTFVFRNYPNDILIFYGVPLTLKRNYVRSFSPVSPEHRMHCFECENKSKQSTIDLEY